MSLSPKKQAFIRAYLASDGNLASALEAERSDTGGSNPIPLALIENGGDEWDVAYAVQRQGLSDISETLTPLQESFVKEFMVDRNPQAALARVLPDLRQKKNPTGNSEVAAFLLGLAKVRRRINFLIEREAEGALARREEVISELGHVAFSDIRKLFHVERLKKISDLDTATAKALKSVKVVAKPGPKDENGEPSIEYVHEYVFWDKLQALDKLAKHHGILNDVPDPMSASDVEAKRGLRRAILATLSDLARPADDDGDVPWVINPDGTDA